MDQTGKALIQFCASTLEQIHFATDYDRLRDGDSEWSLLERQALSKVLTEAFTQRLLHVSRMVSGNSRGELASELQNLCGRTVRRDIKDTLRAAATQLLSRMA